MTWLAAVSAVMLAACGIWFVLLAWFPADPVYICAMAANTITFAIGLMTGITQRHHQL